MAAATPEKVLNRLLAGLPCGERSKILACCETVDLVFGTILCEPDQPFRDVYFPLTGFISLVTTVSGHQPLEMGQIGNEGMLGATLVLAINTAPLRGLVQGGGTALRMSALQLRHELRDSPALHSAISRYLYVSMAQLSQTATCARFHATGARLARCLLMTHDRVHADHFHFTHELLADSLGVRRSGITIAAGALQQRKLIRYTRGEINILDRKGLEAASCECYSATINDYARLLS